MSEVVQKDIVSDLVSARELMARRISDLIAERKQGSISDSSNTARIEIEIEHPPDLSGWLACQSADRKIFWSSRDDSYTMAAIGSADSLSVKGGQSAARLVEQVADRLRGGHDRMRYYGGLAFNGKSIDQSMDVSEEAWGEFGQGRFLLPRFELVSSGQTGYFACNLNLAKDLASCQTILRQLASINDHDSVSGDTSGGLVRIDDCPSREEWLPIFDTALKAINSDFIDKVVLARRSSFDCANVPAANHIFDRLVRNTSHCFHFCFQYQPGTVFLGASPELLYRRDETEIKSEAIAGTRLRGVDELSDLEMERELLASDKEFREHRLVVTGIRAALADLCSSVAGGDEIGIVKLPRVQHLISTIRGQLLESVNDADILSTLHPTPAVGGYPSSPALELIAQVEPFDRGWFASPVGWIGCESAGFAVAIRSGLIHDGILDLYSGAGLVDGSVADDEWMEIESKIEGFLKAISEGDRY